MTRSSLLACLVALAAAAPAMAGDAQRREQAAAMEARRAGKILSVREIERRVLPTMGGARYIGFDFDSGSGIYTLKFLRDGQVIWVDVDGQSGQVLGSTGK
jgi:hypothetical protein